MSVGRASSTDSFPCPGLGCDGQMVPEARNGIVVDRCGECRSVWFDIRELDRWLRSHYQLQVDPGLEERIPPREPAAVQCPRCGSFTETAGWNVLVLNQCRGCRGLFVEAHELAQLERALPPDEIESFEASFKAIMVSTSWNLLMIRAAIVLFLRLLR